MFIDFRPRDVLVVLLGVVSSLSLDWGTPCMTTFNCRLSLVECGVGVRGVGVGV